jgi:hypothetical protein
MFFNQLLISHFFHQINKLKNIYYFPSTIFRLIIMVLVHFFENLSQNSFSYHGQTQWSKIQKKNKLKFQMEKTTKKKSETSEKKKKRKRTRAKL